MWFGRAARLEYEDDAHRLHIAVPNQFVADWIGRNFGQQLHQAAATEVGQSIELNLRIEPQRFDDDPAAPAKPPVRHVGREGDTESRESKSAPTGATRHGRGDSPPRPQRDTPQRTPITARSAALRHDLDDFVVGPSNELAYAAACRFAGEGEPIGGPLFIHGGCGLGKTHLLQGICRRIRRLNPDARIHYTTGEQFTNDFIAAVRQNRLEQFRSGIRRLDLLAIDDVHFLASREKTQQEFLHSFDAIELAGARIVMASDNHPRLVQQFSDALVSRCLRGMVVQVRTPDTQTRIRIVKALARRRGINILETAIAVLASRYQGSVRELEGALTKLQALATLARQRTGRGAAPMSSDEPAVPTIGHMLVNRLFEGPEQPGPTRPVRFEHILEHVEKATGVGREQILGSNRHRLIVLARSLVVYLARQLTTLSFPEIAAAMRRGSHSTIVTANTRLQKQFQAERPTFINLPSSSEPVTLTELIDRLRYTICRHGGSGSGSEADGAG